MRIAILPTPEDIAVVAADRIQQLLARKPAAVLGLATGSTPLPLYDELTKRCEAGQISFAQTQSFNLDEYVGLPEDHPEGYANFIHRFLVDRVDFPKGAAHGPNVWTGDNDQAAADYDKAIRDAGGIDLQILGIGADGHIGFNEPGGSLASRQRALLRRRHHQGSDPLHHPGPRNHHGIRRSTLDRYRCR